MVSDIMVCFNGTRQVMDGVLSSHKCVSKTMCNSLVNTVNTDQCSDIILYSEQLYMVEMTTEILCLHTYMYILTYLTKCDANNF